MSCLISCLIKLQKQAFATSLKSAYLGKAGMSPTIHEACGVLLLNDAPTFKIATETLFKILQNLKQHPEEPKYRSLARSSATFSEKLAHAKGAVRFLKAVGFEEQGGSGDGSSLVLPPKAESAETIVQGKAALKAVLAQHTDQMLREADAKRTQENAAAAQRLADLRDLSKKNSSQKTAEDEKERQRLKAGINGDKMEENKWRGEYDAMGVPGMKPTQ